MAVLFAAPFTRDRSGGDDRLSCERPCGLERAGNTQPVVKAASARWGRRFGAAQQLSPNGREAILGGGGSGSRGIGVDDAGHVSVIWAQDPPAGTSGVSVRRPGAHRPMVDDHLVAPKIPTCAMSRRPPGVTIAEVVGASPRKGI